MQFRENLYEQEILDETLQYLEEALIQFGGKRQTQFGQVIILAGGAGSGKGFVLKNLIDIQAKTLDVDALKEAAAKAPRIVKKVEQETGHDMTKLNLKNPDDVSTMHSIIADVLNLPNKRDQALFTSILAAHPDRKPNLIFDVTLKDMRKLQNISNQVKKIGYKNENIHIVWVVNDIEVAKSQNLKRDRTVPEEVLVSTHRGASMTMKDILDMGERIKSYMDGFIFLAFNKAKIDSELVKSSNKGIVSKVFSKMTGSGSYIKMANYIKVKERGKPQIQSVRLPKEVVQKIKEYTPTVVNWGE